MAPRLRWSISGYKMPRHSVKYPYVRELPQAFLDLMAADLNGPLAEDYRGYIRHEVKPALDRISDVLQAHYAAIEAPSLDWLIETFPGHGKADSPSHIPDSVVAYARAWDRVLAEWDAGRLDVLYPPNHMMPLLAMLKFNTWSKERGEAKQEELIGMSSGQKDASSKRLHFTKTSPKNEQVFPSVDVRPNAMYTILWYTKILVVCQCVFMVNM